MICAGVYSPISRDLTPISGIIIPPRINAPCDPKARVKNPSVPNVLIRLLGFLVLFDKLA